MFLSTADIIAAGKKKSAPASEGLRSHYGESVVAASVSSGSAEDAEESDFCEGMVRVTEEGRRARVTRSAGRAVGLQGTRQRRG